MDKQVASNLALSDFLQEFGQGLLKAVGEQNPPLFQPEAKVNAAHAQILQNLQRQPFAKQSETIHAITQLLMQQPAGIINAEMGTGKTMMGIGVAALLHHAGFQRTLVLSPPHLVYKWRREILSTIPEARVWILNGPDTLKKLLSFRAMHAKPTMPEFFILGRVRMRMGFKWKPAFLTRHIYRKDDLGQYSRIQIAACPNCGKALLNQDKEYFLVKEGKVAELMEKMRFCEAFRKKQQLQNGKWQKTNQRCNTPLWSLHRGDGKVYQRKAELITQLKKIPTIGAVSANRLIEQLGEDTIANLLEDNMYAFLNLMDEDGELMFGDAQMKRMERAMSKMEFDFGQGGYQATEFIKRYLPHHYFGLLLVDEGHEYKNENSAQGQAMGVLARKCQKTVLLTGTLMGGYADDLFHLLWRIHPKMMMEDSYCYNARGSLHQATQSFMMQHGVLEEIIKVSNDKSHVTARGKKVNVRIKKAPGFSPLGIMRFVLPITAFLKLKDIDPNALPSYDEQLVEVNMTPMQAVLYQELRDKLTAFMKQALQKGDTSMMGVVLNTLLAWPDCAFREEVVKHPHSGQVLLRLPAVFDTTEIMPKEQALLALIQKELKQGRKVLVYSVYTGQRDTTARLQQLLEQYDIHACVMRASVKADTREDWVEDKLEQGMQVMICNPELVKTGLDLLQFPTIVFMQTGFNVYTLQQASRRSWRIGQKQPVKVLFLGYAETAQTQCLELMAKKIAVSQSTSGDMPESGLDILNQDAESVEIALARQLITGKQPASATIVALEEKKEAVSFRLGQVVVTATLQGDMQQNPALNAFVSSYLQRHTQGDWGDVCVEDAKANQDALKNGNRIFSSYPFEETLIINAEKVTSTVDIWIITEADRSYTTIMYPSDY